MSGEGVIAGPRMITGADSRPRVHLWLEDAGFRWSIGAVGNRCSTAWMTHGQALDGAIDVLGSRARKGVVVIVEPPHD